MSVLYFLACPECRICCPLSKSSAGTDTMPLVAFVEIPGFVLTHYGCRLDQGEGKLRSSLTVLDEDGRDIAGFHIVGNDG